MKIDQDIHPAGVYSGISNADYHGGPGISKSGLDVIRKSPAHFKQSRSEGYQEPTPSQRLGTMAHALILEPETFWDEYAMPFEAPDGALSTNDEIKARLKLAGEKVSGNKPELIERLRSVDPDAVFLDDAKAAYDEEVGDKEVITAEELEKVEAIRDSVMNHPAAGKLLKPGSGIAELSCYWTDPATGVLCRCRPDFWRHDGIIVDLKTARDASPEGFEKSIEGWRYYVQDPFYQYGISEAVAQGFMMSDIEMSAPKAFIFVAVETVAPYAVGVYVLDPVSVEIGCQEYREDLETYAECIGTDTWPGYSDKIESISLPGWRLRQEEFKNEEEI